MDEQVHTLAPFEKTVAGSTPFLFAQNFPGRVFKPAHPREKEFYESIDLHPLLRPLVPNYHGTLTYSPAHPTDNVPSSNTSPSSTSSTPDSTPSSTPSSTPPSNGPVMAPLEYLVMEDLTFGFTHPCILDVKLGTTHHDIDFTNPQKHTGRQSKYLTAPGLGFCLTGMQVYKKTPSRYEFMDKVEGRNLTATTIVDKLFYFFNDGNGVRKDVIEKLIQRLLKVASYFQNKPAFTFRSSSLLLLYEGKLTAESVDRVEVKMIDFAHARRLPSSAEMEFKDEYGYLYGTNNFINILQNLKERTETPVNTIVETHQFINTTPSTTSTSSNSSINNNNNNSNNTSPSPSFSPTSDSVATPSINPTALTSSTS